MRVIDTTTLVQLIQGRASTQPISQSLLAHWLRMYGYDDGRGIQEEIRENAKIEDDDDKGASGLLEE